MSIDADKLRSMLKYDPTTGEFIWLSTKRSDLVGKRAGSIDGHGYRIIGIEGRRYKAHRLAWLYMTGQWPNADLDHHDNNRDNNRFRNLREASVFQNNQNVSLKKSNSSGFKGVSFDRSVNRWRATIRSNGRRIYLGVFSDPSAAGAAYQRAAHKLHAEFARTA